MTTYESVLQLIESLPSADAAEVREVTWVTGSRVVGVARDQEGRIEVFLAGAELHPVREVVGDVIEFRSWHRNDAHPFDANRLMFPALGHFDQVAAFICTELLRAGADASLAGAFLRTEPIIELAIERTQLTNQAILGLAGELLVLDALCRRAADAQVARIMAAWKGWKRSSRDFSWGSTGVEVKTTTRAISSHLVEGVHQVQRNDGSDDGVSEKQLFLVSIGLEPADFEGNAFTITQLMDRILARIDGAGVDGSASSKFLAHVADYGAGVGGGDEHGGPADDPSFAKAFRTRFFRAYDMSDDSIEVLRREDLEIRRHIDVNSVRFRIALPTIASLGNPIEGANQVAQAILESSA